MLHGAKAAKDSQSTAQKTFVEKSFGTNLPIIKIKKNLISNGIDILNLVIMSKLANSKSEVRRMIKNNGLKINNKVVNDDTKLIDESYLDKEKCIKVSHGKKRHIIVKII